jgi:neurotransmitter:Na+ symporter, NSS family
VKRLKQHAIWGRRGSFILAATGSAVGLGNIWKFPYITGENGGGAFVLMYLVCIALIGIPIMMAEVMLGRRGRANPIVAMQNIRTQVGASRLWELIGWCGVIAAFLILSYYTVIAGWTLEYFAKALEGRLGGLTGDTSNQLFDGLLADRSRLVQWQTIFMMMTIAVLSLGVNKGLEAAIRLMMPLLFILLLVLLVYAYRTGEMGLSARFMFSFNFQDLSWQAALIALGHAFFTLSLAMGAIMAYGSYMPSTASIGKTVLMVAFLDTLVALVAGLTIFAFVFATPGIAPASGPGLMFVTLPVAFGSMAFGSVVAMGFFLMIILAAWSSTISILEPAVAYFTERFGFHRISASLLIGVAAWLLGLGSVLSFNDWSDRQFLWGMNFFASIDFISTNILLPMGGLLIALFVGWAMSREQAEHEFKHESRRYLGLWRFVLRYLSPLAVLAVLINGLYPVITKVLLV